MQSVASNWSWTAARDRAFRTEEYWKITALLTVPGLAKLDSPLPTKVLAKKKGPKPADEKPETNGEEVDDADTPEPDETPEGEAKAEVGEKKAKPEEPKHPDGSFFAELVDWQGTKFKAGSEAEADAVYAVLDNAAYSITNIEQQDRKDYAPPPFTTSGLQQAASIRLYMGAQRTMQAAQKLYEGVAMGQEGQVALITYMRTDSTRVSNDALTMVRGYIDANFGKQYLPDKPNFFKSGKSAQEAHEAIRPTDVVNTPARVQPFLDHDQFRLYTLIYNRFVASQMTPALVATTTVEIKADQGVLKARGQIEKFDGYRKVWPAGKQEDVMLPALSAGQALEKLGLTASQHFTQPPARYNEASLVKVLEKEGIGRPSTYASIIGTITKKGYVDVQNRRFTATELGKTVTDFLVKAFPEVMNVKFTSHFEEELDDISTGKMKSVDVLNEFWEPFQAKIKHADETMEKVKGRETGEACPKCGRPLVEMYSSKRKGTFVGCSGWGQGGPLRHIKPRGEQDLSQIRRRARRAARRWWPGRASGDVLSCTAYKPDGGVQHDRQPRAEQRDDRHRKPTEYACRRAGRTLWRLGKKGPYFTCADKTCKTILEADKTGERPQPPIQTGVNCEKCGSPMVIKKSWRGPFMSCSGFPKCRNAKSLTAELKEKLKDVLPPPPPKKELPHVEVKDLCPECGSPMKLASARGRYFPGCPAWAKTNGKGTKPVP